MIPPTVHGRSDVCDPWPHEAPGDGDDAALVPLALLADSETLGRAIAY
jgi:hypothetical protein